MDGWVEEAKCRGNPERWDADRYPKAERAFRAWALCLDCPVLLQCAQAAIDDGSVQVIRGGVMLPQAENGARKKLTEVIENGGLTRPPSHPEADRIQRAQESWRGAVCGCCGHGLRPSWSTLADFPGTTCAVSMTKCRTCYNHEKWSEPCPNQPAA